MAASQYHLKPEAIWAEQVPEDLASILALATAWGAEVRVHPDTGITLYLRQAIGGSMARPGDWLVDRPGQGKCCCTNEEFVASFDPVVS